MKAVPPSISDLKGMTCDYFFMVDENMSSLGGDDDNDGEHDENGDIGFDKDGNLGGGFGDGVEPKTPENVKEGEESEVKKVKPIEYSNTAPPEFRRVGKVMDVSTVSLIQILTKLDEYFLKALESAQEFCKMLEATRLYYHSNFANNRGHIDHSARVMRVMKWSRSSKACIMGELELGRDEFDYEECESHATVLDKLLAREKKLYEEVNVCFG